MLRLVAVLAALALVAGSCGAAGDAGPTTQPLESECPVPFDLEPDEVADSPSAEMLVLMVSDYGDVFGGSWRDATLNDVIVVGVTGRAKEIRVALEDIRGEFRVDYVQFSMIELRDIQCEITRRLGAQGQPGWAVGVDERANRVKVQIPEGTVLSIGDFPAGAVAMEVELPFDTTPERLND